MNTKQLFAPFAFVLGSAFAIAGCAVDGTADAPVGEDQSALISGTTDPGTSTGTVAEKPKFDISACIVGKVNDGWSPNRANAYCECRAKGYSDMACNNSIPYIDL
jgi:hypothetical protein